jgi:ATP-binding cassette subfamily B protein
MDPAVGRRWLDTKQFLSELYQHAMPAPAAMWREFAGSPEFAKSLEARLHAAGIDAASAKEFLGTALEDTGFQGLAALDAGTRLLRTLIQSGGMRRGSKECARLLKRLLEKPELIDTRYWSATAEGMEECDGEQQLLVRGAVLVRFSGKRPPVVKEELSEELAAALEEKPAQPWRELQQMLRAGGVMTPGLLVIALLSAAAGVFVEALLFRGLFDLAGELHLASQRMAAMGVVAAFCGVLLLLDVFAFSGVARLCRQLELRFQAAFLEKIPRLGDRYFRSRLISDMAERSHTTHRIRHLPEMARRLLRAVFELSFTAAGIVWLEPGAASIALFTVAAALVPALLTQPLLSERDLRTRSHAAALTRYYLDALLGLIAVRSHGAEDNIRRGHERLLGEWASTMGRLQRAAVGVEAVQLVAMFGSVAWLLVHGASHGADIGRVLLLAYWALNLPVVGQEIGALVRQYPFYRNHMLRLLEPLGAPEEVDAHADDRATPAEAPSIRFSGVSVRTAGQEILHDIDVDIASGAQVAIVGPSGAGKSSLIGVLLGWTKAFSGEVSVDEAPLDCGALRAQTAWVDPTVQIWNRSLLSNMSYGSQPSANAIGGAVDAALLRAVIERLPEGMQTPLGESGALLSGGEGQRVRLARAMLRDGVRLVILDEPFRGLDRATRRELLKRAREYWAGCTLLCITHDLEETQSFDRVLVVENGTVIEDDSPEALLAKENSRYACLMTAETTTRELLWEGRWWRRVHVANGMATEEVAHPGERRPEIRVA